MTATAPRDAVERALAAHEDMLDWPDDIVLGGRELAPDKPDEWVLEVWLPYKPQKAERAMIASLFGGAAPNLKITRLADEDWLSMSQQSAQPITAGRFYVHTPDYPPCDNPALINFTIPASQAFGTGQHETTAGCLAMLSAMKARGMVVRNFADIGTGTGLLAFAALRLWPGAYATASDIDPVCNQVVMENAALNGVRVGGRRGALAMGTASGMDSPLLTSRAPYDLVMANILAGPLRELADDFGQYVAGHGALLLAGLLENQKPEVLRCYRRAGFRLVADMTKGDWSILWLRKRLITRRDW